MTNKDVFLVKYPDPGFGITNTHPIIRTEGLATCIATGGIFSNKTNESSLFMIHQPDYAHSSHISILQEILINSHGKLIVFAKIPDQLKPPYTVNIDLQNSETYAKALEIFLKNLKEGFPKFDINFLPYGSRKNPTLYSYAEIDLIQNLAITDYGSVII